jgi:cobalamin biosynthetic protein CobC
MSSISSAKKVSDMSPPGEFAPLAHGGDLAAARLLFPGAPEPFLDLSTGINPHAYPVPQLAPDAFTRLPEPAAIAGLEAIAARSYGAPSGAHVVAAPGTQIVLAHVAALVPPGRAMLLGPIYAEHARAAALAGHAVAEAGDLDALKAANLAVVVNPNNPDGRVTSRAALLALADALEARGGLLVVDEAFMDVGPAGTSLAADVARGNIVVLRSFSKFYGLAGLRLGFALAAPALAVRLCALLGPWAVSGAAIAVGGAALADAAWADARRARLAAEAARLDELLLESGFAIVGGTVLFRLAQAADASARFERLGRAGILVRRYSEHPHWLRFGLPADEAAWTRLGAALAAH